MTRYAYEVKKYDLCSIDVLQCMSEGLASHRARPMEYQCNVSEHLLVLSCLAQSFKHCQKKPKSPISTGTELSYNRVVCIL